ncbi:MAG: hypothetical protein AAGB32_02040 [Pseudomonadota bacterium]
MNMRVTPNNAIDGATPVGGAVGDWLAKRQDMILNGDEIAESAQDRFNRREFEAKAGYNNGAALTNTAALDDRDDRLARERIAAIQVSSASNAIARQFSENLNRGINNTISNLKKDLVEANQVVTEAKGGLEQAQATSADINANHEAVVNDWEAAIEAGDMELADRLAAGGMYTSTRIGVGEAQVDAAQETLETVTEERNKVATELKELEDVQAYIEDSDLHGRLERGEITPKEAEAELVANGMRPELLEQLNGEAPGSEYAASTPTDGEFENHNVVTNGQGIPEGATVQTAYTPAAEGISPVEPVTPGMPQPTVTAPGSTFG